MRLFAIFRLGCLLLIAFFAIAPLLWAISAALSSEPSGIWNFPQAFLPVEPSFIWFKRVTAEIPLQRYLVNSFLMSVSSTLLTLLLAIPCAYALAFMDFRGRNCLFILFAISMMMPSELALVPNFLTFSRLGLLDSYVAAVLPNIASAFGVILMRQAFQDLPREILDAARVDGAGEGRLLWSVALPMVRPMVATLAIFSFVLAWNDYLWPAVVLKSRIKMPIAVGIYNDLTGPFATSSSMVFAALVLAILPLLFLFTLGQKYFLSAPASDD
jgi:putative chitobiose transport system permease protein